MKEAELRLALLRRLRAPGVLVREEWGLIGHAVRVDVAALDATSLALYEIKSDADALKRLPLQVEMYSKVANRAAVVCGRRHVEKLELPSWWDIWVERGDELDHWHRGAENPSPDPVAVARLMWSGELATVLRGTGMRGVTKMRIQERAELLAKVRSLPLIRERAFGFLRARPIGLGGFKEAA